MSDDRNTRTYQQRKLSFELVPKPQWKKSLYHILPRQEWDTVRKIVISKQNRHCGICGSEGSLSCHEQWQYDDKNHIQTLAGVIAICHLCHAIKHYGLTMVRATEGKEDLNRVIDHYCLVNSCSREEFELDRKEAFHHHHIRSLWQWEQVIGNYWKLLT